METKKRDRASFLAVGLLRKKRCLLLFLIILNGIDYLITFFYLIISSNLIQFLYDWPSKGRKVNVFGLE